MIDFSALYRKYAPDVYRFALYLSSERAEAEDLTSETFVRAWTSPEPIEMATVKGYLFTIARNLFLQGLRKKSRHVALNEGCLMASGQRGKAHGQQDNDRRHPLIRPSGAGHFHEARGRAPAPASRECSAIFSPPVGLPARPRRIT